MIGRSRGRALSADERALAASVFGNAIDYDRVRVHNRKWWPFQPARVVMAPDGHMWFHPEGGLFRACFAAADIRLQALFLHEMTHVWQHQSGIFLPLKRHPFCRYAYAIQPGRAFSRYGLEQQAEIVRHAFLLREGRAVVGAPPLATYEALLPFRPAE